MSSESSDEENLDLLKEAADFQFINDSMFNKKTTDTDQVGDNLTNHKKPTRVPPQPSLRRKTTDEDEQFNLFRVTPEFRNHMAKHLSRILEEKLQKQISVKTTSNIQNNKNDSDTNTRKLNGADKIINKKKSGGVRLFKNSKKLLRATNNKSTTVVVNNNNTANKNRVNIIPKQKVCVTEQDLKQISVSPEDILSKKEVRHWSNRSKAPVFCYQQLKTGELVELENKNTFK